MNSIKEKIIAFNMYEKIKKQIQEIPKSMQNKNRVMPFAILIVLLTVIPITSNCSYTVNQTLIEKKQYKEVIFDIQKAETSLFIQDKDLLIILKGVFSERSLENEQAKSYYEQARNGKYAPYATYRLQEIIKNETVDVKPKIKGKNPYADFEMALIKCLSNNEIASVLGYLYQKVLSTSAFDREDKDELDIKLSDLKNHASFAQLISLQKTLEQYIGEDKSHDNGYYSKLYYYKFIADFLINPIIGRQHISYLIASYEKGQFYYYSYLSFIFYEELFAQSLLNGYLESKQILDDLIKPEAYLKSFKVPKKYTYNVPNKLVKMPAHTTMEEKENFSSYTSLWYLSQYFLSNNLEPELIRSLLYMRNFTNRPFEVTAVIRDYFLYSREYYKASYYQWIILKEKFNAMEQLDFNDSVLLFPLWYQDEILQAYKNPLLVNADKIANNKFLMNRYFLTSIMFTESSFNQNAQSGANAKGLFQLLPKTAKWILKYRENDIDSKLYNPVFNTVAALEYLHYLYTLFDKSIILTLASYNSGPQNTKKFLFKTHPLILVDRIPIAETTLFTKRIIRNFLAYQMIYEHISYKQSLCFLLSVE